MLGKATLFIPSSGNIGPTSEHGLSDEVAVAMGRAAATTLSEEDGYVTVTLESGETLVIGFDTLKHEITIGRLEHHYGT